MYRRVFIFVFLFLATHARGDELLYRYEADVVPYDESAGWGNGLCDGPCSESLANGYFILTFAGGGDLPNYILRISLDPVEDPPPNRCGWSGVTDPIRLLGRYSLVVTDHSEFALGKCLI